MKFIYYAEIKLGNKNRLYKIGISNDPDERVKRFNGKLLMALEYDKAATLEKYIITKYRDLSLKAYGVLQHKNLPLTETFVEDILLGRSLEDIEDEMVYADNTLFTSEARLEKLSNIMSIPRKELRGIFNTTVPVSSSIADRLSLVFNDYDAKEKSIITKSRLLKPREHSQEVLTELFVREQGYYLQLLHKLPMNDITKEIEYLIDSQ